MHYELEKVQVIDSCNILLKYDENNKDIYTNKYFKVLFNDGVSIINDFLKLNNMKNIIVKIEPKERSFDGYCGWQDFNTNIVHIIIEKCARINLMYSYPNFTSNRTPQGVLIHEFGHLITAPKYRPWNGSNKTIKDKVKEKCISSYAPNSNEWVAEQLKLFITNPDLLKILRPKTYNEFSKYWKPLNRGLYKEVLKYPLGYIPERIEKRLEAKLDKI